MASLSEIRQTADAVAVAVDVAGGVRRSVHDPTGAIPVRGIGVDVRPASVCDLTMPDDYILQWGNPALYEQARPIAAFDDLVHAQAARLRRRLEAAGGAGLAATQVGSLRRMFAFRLSPEHEPDVLVNPRIVWRSREQELFHEGCLSFLSVVVAVRRPIAVRVVGYSVDGDAREFECEDFQASLMQHEIDHLDGVLTLHRAEPEERYRAITALLSARTAESGQAA